MSVKNLVIVESPGKIKTISKFLGKDFTVMASMGHVRDLPKSKLGIDVAKNFEPTYLVSKEKKNVIKDLKAKIGKDTHVWIATDEDREGEAIGWHLVQALDLEKNKDLKRIVFHEITQPAILDAIAHPRSLDLHKVNAQQARRILDRLVGYELSPLLWKKIRYGLSAGRVQSVAVRLIVDREREIEAFNIEEYWSITAQFTHPETGESFEAKLAKVKMGNEAEAKAILKELENAMYEVTSVEEKEVNRTPAPPFTTSTLQQEASRKLGFSVKKTMSVAQGLYEGVELSTGHEGLITYMRTDSVTLSPIALAQAKEVVSKMYGKEYALDTPRFYKGRKNAQEAHEAIRPSDLSRTPESIQKYLDKDEYRLYELIWKRTLACQMQTAVLNQVGVDIEAKKYNFRATGQSIRFAGFMKVYMEDRDEDEEAEDDEKMLPILKKGDKPKLKELVPAQHFTKPPARYTEASLVKVLEAQGIGRPSTYAPTISTVQVRGYVEKDGKQLKPTDIGMVVTDFLVTHFPKVVDYQFTVRMEEMLDEVEEGKESWQDEVRSFYEPFHTLVEEKTESVSREDAGQNRDLGVDPKSGKPVSVRLGRFGAFVQLGDKEDEEKPKFAPLPEGLSLHEITLEQALPLFRLPRELGVSAEGEKILANIGRFGPYVQVGKKYVSLKEDDPYTVTLEKAKELIAADAEKKAKAVIQVFEAEDIHILEGMYGPYIKQGKVNYKIPKDKDAHALTLEDCLAIIAEGPSKKGRRTFGKGRKK
jgi:DNA topoisomerase-1